MESIGIGTYIICYEKNSSDPNLENSDDLEVFLLTNIGRILEKDDNGYNFIVKYNNIPDDLITFFSYKINNCRPMNYNEIIYSSNDKNEVECYIESNKYNL